MAIYGEMPAGWKLNNVSMGGEPSFVKAFEVERSDRDQANLRDLAKSYGAHPANVPPQRYKRKVMVALNPFSGKWFWQTTGTVADEGKGDSMEYDDPVACAVVCEMTFGSNQIYEPAKRNEHWQEGTG